MEFYIISNDPRLVRDALLGLKKRHHRCRWLDEKGIVRKSITGRSPLEFSPELSEGLRASLKRLARQDAIFLVDLVGIYGEVVRCIIEGQLVMLTRRNETASIAKTAIEIVRVLKGSNPEAKIRILFLDMNLGEKLLRPMENEPWFQTVVRFPIYLLSAAADHPVILESLLSGKVWEESDK